MKGHLGTLESCLSPVGDGLEFHSVVTVWLKPLQSHKALRLQISRTHGSCITSPACRLPSLQILPAHREAAGQPLLTETCDLLRSHVFFHRWDPKTQFDYRSSSISQPRQNTSVVVVLKLCPQSNYWICSVSIGMSKCAPTPFQTPPHRDKRAV